jgi:hypothetical protein
MYGLFMNACPLLYETLGFILLKKAGKEGTRTYQQPFEFLVSQEGTGRPLCFIFCISFSLTEGLTPPHNSFL